jgi:hypothetical protein
MREGEPNYAYNPFNLSWERLLSTETFPTDRGRRWAVWDAMVGSGNNRLRIQAYGRQTFSRSRLSLRQCSNEKNALMPLVTGTRCGHRLTLRLTFSRVNSALG